MGRSPSITVGDARDGVRVEHVKGRGLVRLVRWTAGRVEDDGIGLEVSEFCSRLGLTKDVLGPSAHYLLVAGTVRPGAGHVVSFFDSEQDARAAFVTVRRSHPGAEAWAELTELTVGGDVRRLCWFGTPAASSHQDLRPAAHGTERMKRHDRTLGRVLRRWRVANATARRTLRASLAAILVAVAVGLPGAASAQTTGNQTFRLVFTADPTQEPGRVIAHGPVAGVGTVRVTSPPGGVLTSVYDFDDGTLAVTATPVSGSFEPNFRSCTARVTSTSQVQITAGTGSYVGISGTGTATSRGVLIWQRAPDGTCPLGQEPPARGVEVVTVTATVSQPG